MIQQTAVLSPDNVWLWFTDSVTFNRIRHSRTDGGGTSRFLDESRLLWTCPVIAVTSLKDTFIQLLIKEKRRCHNYWSSKSVFGKFRQRSYVEKKLPYKWLLETENLTLLHFLTIMTTVIKVCTVTISAVWSVDNGRWRPKHYLRKDSVPLC